MGNGGYQRYRCQSCCRSFQLKYRCYKACEKGVKEQVVDLAMNNNGIRGTAKVLRIGINTVLRTLKNLTRSA